ncbi:hypothetical protein L596_021106 [Steinernema carpocapsae]|uniref:Uncharacterized protein n=1 Tax=Steinernema carpocapsae TaxID=34508 RepID=A0A4U5MVR0_STECR|nr:hypothetical protein L596_021106 [Steinernema carpocapsae]
MLFVAPISSNDLETMATEMEELIAWCDRELKNPTWGTPPKSVFDFKQPKMPETPKSTPRRSLGAGKRASPKPRIIDHSKNYTLKPWMPLTPASTPKRLPNPRSVRSKEVRITPLFKRLQTTPSVTYRNPNKCVSAPTTPVTRKTPGRTPRTPIPWFDRLSTPKTCPNPTPRRPNFKSPPPRPNRASSPPSTPKMCRIVTPKRSLWIPKPQTPLTPILKSPKSSLDTPRSEKRVQFEDEMNGAHLNEAFLDPNRLASNDFPVLKETSEVLNRRWQVARNAREVLDLCVQLRKYKKAENSRTPVKPEEVVDTLKKTKTFQKSEDLKEMEKEIERQIWMIAKTKVALREAREEKRKREFMRPLK